MAVALDLKDDDKVRFLEMKQTKDRFSYRKTHKTEDMWILFFNDHKGKYHYLTSSDVVRNPESNSPYKNTLVDAMKIMVDVAKNTVEWPKTLLKKYPTYLIFDHKFKVRTLSFCPPTVNAAAKMTFSTVKLNMNDAIGVPGGKGVVGDAYEEAELTVPTKMKEFFKTNYDGEPDCWKNLGEGD